MTDLPKSIGFMFWPGGGMTNGSLRAMFQPAQPKPSQVLDTDVPGSGEKGRLKQALSTILSN